MLNKSVIYYNKCTLDSQYIIADKLQNIFCKLKATYYIFRILIHYFNSSVTAKSLIRSYLIYSKPLYINIFDVASDNMFNLKYQELDK